MRRLLLGVTAAWLAVVMTPYGAERRPAAQTGAVPRSLPEGRNAPGPLENRALLGRYCLGCHNGRLKSGGLALDAVDLANVADHQDVWEKVALKLRAGMMPPVGRPRPDRETSRTFVSWLEGELDRAAESHPNPGRTETFHRLNRAEYHNAIRDLLDLDMDVRSLLPADDASYGFDNMAGVLKLNEALLESYLSAASKISRAAMGSNLPIPASEEFRVSEESRQYDHVEGLPLGTRGGLRVEYNFPQDGEYLLRVDLLCRMAGCDGSAGFADRHELEILVDGQPVHVFALEPHEDDNPEIVSGLKVRVAVKAGRRAVVATFRKLPSAEEVESHRQRLMKPFYLNGNFMQQKWAIYQPFVDKLTITGPFDTSGPGDSPSRRRILVCRAAAAQQEPACARTILESLARRAYRRSATEADIHDLMGFYADGREQGGFDAGIELALRRVLVNPEFLFRVEAEPANLAPDANYRLSDFDLASRLSFFLWSSIPDDELLGLAARGKLSDPHVLEQQVRRMLADSRAFALVGNFTGQWLQLRNLDAHRPAIPLFPDFDDSLRDAFRTETELFVQSIVREDRSAVDLLTADYTFVNERLARHYGIPHVQGSHFRRVTIADPHRRGLLGQGSVLTVTSRPNRTSPVLRGKWILETLLGTPPPPPPPVVPSLPEPVDGSKERFTSVRDRLAEHRANPACTNCHAAMDPLGFALENYDAVGRWRERDESSNAIDASGELPNGVTFANLDAFRNELLAAREQFVRTLTAKLMAYSLGRGLEPYDFPTVRRITREAAGVNYRLSAIIVGIVKSAPFQMRRSDPGAMASAARHKWPVSAESVPVAGARRPDRQARRASLLGISER